MGSDLLCDGCRRRDSSWLTANSHITLSSSSVEERRLETRARGRLMRMGGVLVFGLPYRKQPGFSHGARASPDLHSRYPAF